jgi:hypothetical protein
MAWRPNLGPTEGLCWDDWLLSGSPDLFSSYLGTDRKQRVSSARLVWLGGPQLLGSGASSVLWALL